MQLGVNFFLFERKAQPRRTHDVRYAARRLLALAVVINLGAMGFLHEPITQWTRRAITNPPEPPTPADAVENKHRRVVDRMFDVRGARAGQADKVRMKCADDFLT